MGSSILKNAWILFQNKLLKLLKLYWLTMDHRFLSIPLEKRVESVKRYRKWQQTSDKDAFFDEIFGDHKRGIS